MGKKYAAAILGQICLDINTDYTGETRREVGGAVVYSGFAAAGLGHAVCVIPKADTASVDLQEIFRRAQGVEVMPLHSATSTSIENVYHTPDRERRTSRAISRIAPYRVEELPAVDAHILHIAGLMRGDMGNEIIAYGAERGAAAVDVQCMLRCAEGEQGDMVFRDWAEKREILPLIRFLKTDAAEAEILTGVADRAEAAKLLHRWGAKEIMITHNTEALVYDGREFYTRPLRPRSLSGRTGRGDTCFAAYITERLQKGIPDALLTAAALVSLKMETPGPFLGGREDVGRYIAEYYGR